MAVGKLVRTLKTEKGSTSNVDLLKLLFALMDEIDQIKQQLAP